MFIFSFSLVMSLRGNAGLARIDHAEPVGQYAWPGILPARHDA